MAIIQKAIPGLAKFLGIQTQGLLRLQAVESCQPVLEIEDYLGPNKWTYGTGTLTNVGDTLEIQVPDKKFWRMRWFACRIITNAAAINIVHPYIRKREVPGVNLSLNPLPARWDNSASGLGNQSAKYGFAQRLRDLNGEPGDHFGIELMSTTVVAPFTVHMFWQYQELDL